MSVDSGHQLIFLNRNLQIVESCVGTLKLLTSVTTNEQNNINYNTIQYVYRMCNIIGFYFIFLVCGLDKIC